MRGGKVQNVRKMRKGEVGRIVRGRGNKCRGK